MIAVVVQCSLTLWYVHAFSKLGGATEPTV